MSPAEIQSLVDRGLAVVASITQLEAELNQIEGQLARAGYHANLAGHVEPLKDAKREGRRWLAHGSTRVLPVIFTADKLISSFTEDGEVHKVIAPIAGGRLEEFFKRTVKYENRFDSGVKFRRAAGQLLNRKEAPAFITACLARDKCGLPKSDIKFEWDRTEGVVGEMRTRASLGATPRHGAEFGVGT